MLNIPKFLLYGQDDPRIEEDIQPRLPLRRWGNLEAAEKETALRELKNNGWLKNYSSNILETIDYLNHNFLRQCPGKNLPKFAESYIDKTYYQWAKKEQDEIKRDADIAQAFSNFDRLANCFNHIFDQFSINALFTRNGLVPRQDEKITEEVYVPTLKILTDPKWKTVSNDLAQMFEDYREENYSEAITKAHRAVQRFLQILVGEEGKSGKGEIGKLFIKAKLENIIPANHFTEPIVNVFQSYISSERATNSTAKPALKEATPSDALLMMNVVMVFLQFCLQKK